MPNTQQNTQNELKKNQQKDQGGQYGVLEKTDDKAERRQGQNPVAENQQYNQKNPNNNV